MAETAYWRDPFEPVAEEQAAAPQDGSLRASDWWYPLKAGAQEVGSAASAATRYVGEWTGKRGIAAAGEVGQDIFTDWAQENIKSMSPEAQKRIEAAVTSKEFWE